MPSRGSAAPANASRSNRSTRNYTLARAADLRITYPKNAPVPAMSSAAMPGGFPFSMLPAAIGSPIASATAIATRGAATVSAIAIAMMSATSTPVSSVRWS